MDRRLDPRVARLLPAAVDVQGRVRGAGRAGHPAQVPLSRCIMHRMLDRTRPGTVRTRARSALETPWRRLLHGTLQCCACGLCRRVPETERGVYCSDLTQSFKRESLSTLCVGPGVGHTRRESSQKALAGPHRRLSGSGLRAWVWEHSHTGQQVALSTVHCVCHSPPCPALTTVTPFYYY